MRKYTSLLSEDFNNKDLEPVNSINSIRSDNEEDDQPEVEDS